jgi:hypothetical protein
MAQDGPHVMDCGAVWIMESRVNFGSGDEDMNGILGASEPETACQTSRRAARGGGVGPTGIIGSTSARA